MAQNTSTLDDPFSLDYLNALNHQTPFLLLDLARIEKSYKNLRAALSGVQLFYAVKANAEVCILKCLIKLGAQFEIASINELHLLISLGVNPKKVVYSNPVKPGNHIKQAFELGVSHFAFDSVPELEKLSKYAPGSAVFLRFAVNDQGSVFPLSKKFGAESQDIVSLMSMARDLGFVTYGLTFHVGSQSLNPRMWESAIKIAGDAMKELLEHGIKIEVLDIGGGFPAYYGQDEPGIKLIGEVISAAVARYLPYSVQLFAEPGRALVAEAGVLVASVIGRAVRGGKNWLYLDVGAFNGMMETLETENQFYYPLATSRDSRYRDRQKTTLFTLTGPTCDPQDTMFYNVALPHDLMINDRIYISSAGAYTTTYASTFNGFDVPKAHCVKK